MRNMLKINLEIDKTLPYFNHHIACGNTLSQKVIRKMIFSHGDFFTILPENADLTRLYEFPYGGIIPPIPYGDKVYYIEGQSEPFHPQQVITVCFELSAFIKLYLGKQPKNYSILEAVILRSYDSNLDIKNVTMIPFQEEVYYLLNNTNSTEEIEETIRTSEQVWHFLAVLTELDRKPSNHLTNEDFDRICDQIKLVVVGAYDGEGYIFWEKNNKD